MQVLICLYNAKFSGVVQYCSWRHLNKYLLTITKDARTNEGSIPLASSLVNQWRLLGLLYLWGVIPRDRNDSKTVPSEEAHMSVGDISWEQERKSPVWSMQAAPQVGECPFQVA